VSGIFDEALIVDTIKQILGYAVGGAVEPAIAVAVQGIVNDLWASHTDLPLDPATAGLAAMRNPGNGLDHAAESSLTGLSPTRAGWVRDSLLQPPDVGSLLQLLQRGKATEAEVIAELTAGGLPPAWSPRIPILAQQLLSAADVAMARQQQFIDQPTQYAMASLVGVDGPTAELMFELAGLPPGIGEGLELLRRGHIDQARFLQYVAEGHTKTKYGPDLLMLQYQPLSAALAAEAVMRQRMSAAQGAAIAAQWGIDGPTFTQWIDVIGRPPGIMEALTLVNRKIFTEADFTEVVARSDVRTEYAPALRNLAVKYPSLFQITHALTAGTVTDALAQSTLELEGYTPEWVASVVAAGHKTKTAAHKNLSLSIIETLYDAGLESEPQALTAIEALGYDAAEAAELLLLHDARRYVSELVRAVNAIRTKYVAHTIDLATAQGLLAGLNLTATTENRLLALWQTESQANVRTLTPAQVGQALKYQIIAEAEAVTRWEGLGYSARDATILADIVAKGPAHPLP
jgi:hypothetical protein